MTGAILVFLGAGCGGVLRYGTVLLAARLLGPSFPWGTLIVNVAGSFLMGMLAAALVRAGSGLSQETRLLLGTGALGGFTTFSAFSLDAVALWERGAPGLAVAYVGGSVLLSITALVAGLALVRGLG